MTYPEAILYLESFVNYEKYPNYPYKRSFRLRRVKDFLNSINAPQGSLKAIHVAGSKGKGSTSAFIAYILRESGFKVGLYTSPHLSDFRERIRILKPRPKSSGEKTQDPFEGMIPRVELLKLVSYFKPRIDNFNKLSKSGPLTFFEIVTVLAFVYFKDNNVDFVVLETGLGGRLDATNVVKPLVSVITPISYEHTAILGNTLSEIAGEKAGIIKKNIIVVSAPQPNEAMKVIKSKCKELSCELREAGNAAKYRLNLLGAHQLMNAGVALEAIKALNLDISDTCIKKGLENTVWPGRCEIINRCPYIILDGAQNKASARAIKNTIVENFDYNKLILILGVSNDKDIKGICFELSPIAGKVILTKANSLRATNPGILAKEFKEKDKYITESVKEAKNLARSLAGKDDLILVTGSLFVVGEFRNAQK